MKLANVKIVIINVLPVLEAQILNALLAIQLYLYLNHFFTNVIFVISPYMATIQLNSVNPATLLVCAVLIIVNLAVLSVNHASNFLIFHPTSA